MAMTPDHIATLLRSVRFNHTSEDELQRGIERVFTDAGVGFEREVVLGPHDRIDFLVGDIGIETKVDGAFNAVLRQVQRYLEYDRIGTVVLVTTRSKHRGMPATMRGKPVYVVALETGLL